MLTISCSIMISAIIISNAPRQSHGKDEWGGLQCHRRYYHIPKCVDHPDGYGCKCGPGFFWNGRMCVASGLDSTFEFSSTSPVRYTELTNRPFPELNAFSIAFWVKVTDSNHPGTLLSYTTHDGSKNPLVFTLGPTISFKIHDEEVKSGLQLNQSQWTHLVWTWTSADGSWRIYVDGGGLTLKGRAPRSDFPIPSGGEFILGQTSRIRQGKNKFDLSLAFAGEIAFVNIWKRLMRRDETKAVANDCQMMRCGNVVEWADFRSGMHGSLRIKWPSAIFEKPCQDAAHYSTTCNRHCSVRKGAQCNEEYGYNVLWPRTPSNHTITIPCPGMKRGQRSGHAASGYRVCYRTTDTDGKWADVVMDECTSPTLLEFKKKVLYLASEKISLTGAADMISNLNKITLQTDFSNPTDIRTVLDVMDIIVMSQLVAVTQDKKIENHRPAFKIEMLTVFFELLLEVLENVLNERYAAGWTASLPIGYGGTELLRIFGNINELLTQFLQIGDPPVYHALSTISSENIELKITSYDTKNMRMISSYAATRSKASFLKNSTRGSISLSVPDILQYTNITTVPDNMFITCGRLPAAYAVPYYNLTWSNIIDDAVTVNSDLFYIRFDDVVFDINDSEMNVTSGYGLTLKFTYLDESNVSNPVCVRYLQTNRSSIGYWSTDGCHLHSNTSEYSICLCRQPGIFAVLTNIYKVNLDTRDHPNILMDIPSYIGCSLSAGSSLLTLILHFHYRTSSKTAALHKNFAISIMCSQLCFMIGIDRSYNKVVCRVFAIFFNYFFLSNFFWLMNEAFNLYIVITYAAHSHGEHTEGGSQWRYYILGWIIPAILVGSFVGTYQGNYYAVDMCWIAWQHVWLFIGPAVGVLSVTVMVLIFIAKEHHESAYSKNEETNNMIILYSKALWTQTILITLCWAFAILTIKMRGIIIKCLYALFNGLQGAFFLVFFFFLHDEVQRMIKIHLKKRSNDKRGYEMTGSSDSFTLSQQLQESRTIWESGDLDKHGEVHESEMARVNQPTLCADDNRRHLESDVVITTV